MPDSVVFLGDVVFPVDGDETAGTETPANTVNLEVVYFDVDSEEA